MTEAWPGWGRRRREGEVGRGSPSRSFAVEEGGVEGASAGGDGARVCSPRKRPAEGTS